MAAAFVTGYLTFRWSDPADGLRRRCRPFDSDQVDAALAGPGVPPNRLRRDGEQETDRVVTVTVNTQDRAVDHLDATVAAAVTIDRPGRPDQSVTAFVDVRVVATPAGWVVSQLDQ